MGVACKNKHWIEILAKEKAAARNVPLTWMIDRSGFPICSCTVRATIELGLGFYPMPHDPAVAVATDWRQTVDGAFEAVEYMSVTRRDHFKGKVIVIAAHFALSHCILLSPSARHRVDS